MTPGRTSKEMARPRGETSNRLFETFAEWAVILDGTPIDDDLSPFL